MNVLAMPTDSAVRALVTGNHARGWWNDKSLLKLAHRTAFRDCNQDEFDQAVAFCREKSLSPMSGQLFAFVFNKDDPKKRNMVIVTSIMGYRAIANRAGDYMPGPTKAFFDPDFKDALTNPRGIVRAEATVERFIHGGWKSLTEEATWESFAPLIKSGEDEGSYEWVETGETWPNGDKKKRKKLREGAKIVQRLDPKKDGWIRMPDVMLKKCPEAAGLRRGWPEDLSGLYVEEEIHRSQVIDAEYQDLTPSEVIARIDTEDRIARLGGPSLFATFDATGTLERVEIGKFADRMVSAIEGMAPADVAALVDRNKVAINEFWAHNKTDALELKKILEQRSGVAGERSAAGEGTRAKAASPQHGDSDKGEAARPAREKAFQKLEGTLAERHRDNLMRQIDQLDTPNDLLAFARDADAEIGRLPDAMADSVRAAFNGRQHTVKGMHR